MIIAIAIVTVIVILNDYKCRDHNEDDGVDIFHNFYYRENNVDDKIANIIFIMTMFIMIIIIIIIIIIAIVIEVW